MGPGGASPAPQPSIPYVQSQATCWKRLGSGTKISFASCYHHKSPESGSPGGGRDAPGVKLGGVEVIVWYSKYELKRRKLMGSRPLFRNRREKYGQANLSLRHEGCFPSQVFACCPCFASKSPGRAAQPEPQRSQRVLGCAELLGSQEQRARVTASAPWSRCRGGDNSPFLPSQERGVPKSR